MATMTNEEFRRKVLKVNSNFEVLSEYKGSREKILRRCKVCGDERVVNAGALLEGRGCQVCVKKASAQKRKKTPEDFKKEVAKKQPNIELLSDYKSAQEYILCRCKIHDYQWRAKACYLVSTRKCGCKMCGYEKASSKQRTPFEEVKRQVEEVHPEFEVFGEEFDKTWKFKCRCKVCGYEWKNSLRSLKAYGCAKCKGKAKPTTEEFKEELLKISPTIEVIGQYKARHSPIACKCKICEHEWKSAPGNLIAGWGCPKCKTTRGERKIAQKLDELNISYIREKTFPDCKNIHSLFFDFYIPDLNTCIEYDGEQHYRPVTFGGNNDTKAIERYKSNVTRDKIKTDYCKNNGIKLIRIPYTDFDNIESILDKHFS